MRVNVGGLDVTVDTIEELEQLVHHFGQNGVPKQPSPKATPSAPNPAAPSAGNGNGGSVVQDRVILHHLIDAGEVGVHTNHLGDMLGRKGKAMKPALLQWAVKVKLATDETNDPFEKSRPGGGRGWKIKPTLMAMAKELLASMK